MPVPCSVFSESELDVLLSCWDDVECVGDEELERGEVTCALVVVVESGAVFVS